MSRSVLVIFYMLVGGGCSSDPPSDAQCFAMVDNLDRIGGVGQHGGGARLVEKCKRVPKDQIDCLINAVGADVADCPGFAKLDIWSYPFTRVHCYTTTTTSGGTASTCAKPWRRCEDLRQDDLAQGGGKTVSECRDVEKAWDITFACDENPSRGMKATDTCILYYATKDECAAAYPEVKAERNNVTSDCVPGGRPSFREQLDPETRRRLDEIRDRVEREKRLRAGHVPPS